MPFLVAPLLALALQPPGATLAPRGTLRYLREAQQSRLVPQSIVDAGRGSVDVP